MYVGVSNPLKSIDYSQNFLIPKTLAVGVQIHVNYLWRPTLYKFLLFGKMRFVAYRHLADLVKNGEISAKAASWTMQQKGAVPRCKSIGEFHEKIWRFP